MAADSEKQRLIETQAEHHVCSPRGNYLDSDVSDENDLLCHQLDLMSPGDSSEKRSARRKLLTACAVSVVFMVVEVIGGYAAGSLAIMTDAAHLLTDLCSIVISLFSLWLSSRPSTQTMTFGWHRAEILSVLLSVVSIWGLTAVLVLFAVQRIAGGDYEIQSHIMILTSAFSVGVNVLMILILHQSGASHGHSHDFPAKRQQKNGRDHRRTNASVKAAFVHFVGDLLQSVGVLLAATIIHFWPQYKIADPICTFLFSVIILGTTCSITKDVFRILMDGAPQGVNFNAVRELLLSVRGVRALHSLHMWSLNTTRTLLSVHVVAEDDADPQNVLAKATEQLRSEFGFSSITIQVETGRTSQAEQ